MFAFRPRCGPGGGPGGGERARRGPAHACVPPRARGARTPPRPPRRPDPLPWKIAPGSRVQPCQLVHLLACADVSVYSAPAHTPHTRARARPHDTSSSMAALTSSTAPAGCAEAASAHGKLLLRERKWRACGAWPRWSWVDDLSLSIHWLDMEGRCQRLMIVERIVMSSFSSSTSLRSALVSSSAATVAGMAHERRARERTSGSLGRYRMGIARAASSHARCTRALFASSRLRLTQKLSPRPMARARALVRREVKHSSISSRWAMRHSSSSRSVCCAGDSCSRLPAERLAVRRELALNVLEVWRKRDGVPLTSRDPPRTEAAANGGAGGYDPDGSVRIDGAVVVGDATAGVFGRLTLVSCATDRVSEDGDEARPSCGGWCLARTVATDDGRTMSAGDELVTGDVIGREEDDRDHVEDRPMASAGVVELRCTAGAVLRLWGCSRMALAPRTSELDRLMTCRCLCVYARPLCATDCARRACVRRLCTKRKLKKKLQSFRSRKKSSPRPAAACACVECVPVCV